MPSTFGEEIQKAIRTELLNTIIGSPRFTDYRVMDFIDTGAFESIENVLNERIEALTKQQTSKTNKEVDKMRKDLEQQLSQMREVIKNVQDPRGFAEDKILDALERIPMAKAALRFIPIISAAIAAPEIINKIIDVLLMPGGPFDRRLRVILDNNIEQFFSREDQHRRRIGLDQVIITQHSGYGNSKGRLTTNTLNQKKATGVTEIGLNETAIGLD